MQRPLYLLPALFAAAGLVYVCPERVSLALMKKDGIPSSEFLGNCGRYEAESRDVAQLVLKKCHAMRKSYVLLELGDGKELLDEISADSETNVVKVFRNEAPVAGTHIAVTLPKAVGHA